MTAAAVPAIPAPVRIGPFTWTFVCDLETWKAQPEHAKAHALCETATQEIFVDPEALEKGAVRLRMLLLHEVLHACIYSSGSEIVMKDEDTAEESLVTCAAPMLLQVLRDNPEFVRWLQA